MKTIARWSSMNSQLSEILPFLENQTPQTQALIKYYSTLLIDQGLTLKMRYKIPFFDRFSWVCYLNPIKKDGIELAFINGSELSDESGILDQKGRKQIRGISIYSLQDYSNDLILSSVHEALLLDEYKHQMKK